MTAHPTGPPDWERYWDVRTMCPARVRHEHRRRRIPSGEPSADGSRSMKRWIAGVVAGLLVVLVGPAGVASAVDPVAKPWPQRTTGPTGRR